jgi:hypothetical protein
MPDDHRFGPADSIYANELAIDHHRNEPPHRDAGALNQSSNAANARAVAWSKNHQHSLAALRRLNRGRDRAGLAAHDDQVHCPGGRPAHARAGRRADASSHTAYKAMPRSIDPQNAGHQPGTPVFAMIRP